jgi:hypothetical protein
MEKEILNILRLARILLSDEKYISEEQADKEWEEYQKLHRIRPKIKTRQDYLEMKGKEIEKKEIKKKEPKGEKVSDDLKDRLEEHFEMDKKYLELAKDPERNKEELEKMVSDKAKESGYDIKAYHGTKSKEFFKFIGMWNYRFEEEKGTSYFSDDKDIAKGYGNRVMPVYLNFNNPLFFDAQGNHWTDVNWSALNKARMDGNDGIIINNVNDTPAGVSERFSTVYITLTDDFPSKIKSADLVTYDKDKIIPLSQRFNDKSDDIRY